MGHFQIGWAEADITPDKKVSLVGQFAERISEYVEKPLTATAMAVTTDDEQLVLCSCDLVGISYTLVDAVRAKLPAMIFYKDMPYARVELAKLTNDAGIIGAAMLGR